jgi:hypothetical protein
MMNTYHAAYWFDPSYSSSEEEDENRDSNRNEAMLIKNIIVLPYLKRHQPPLLPYTLHLSIDAV